MPEWEDRMYKAIYRLLILGASLAGAYQEPLHRCEDEEDPDLGRIQPIHRISFLARFAVANSKASDDEEEATIGPAGSWLFNHIVSDTAGRASFSDKYCYLPGWRGDFCALREDNDCPLEAVEGLSHSDAHFVVWELMKVL